MEKDVDVAAFLKELDSLPADDSVEEGKARQETPPTPLSWN